jgi:hypothetical protein
MPQAIQDWSGGGGGHLLEVNLLYIIYLHLYKGKYREGAFIIISVVHFNLNVQSWSFTGCTAIYKVIMLQVDRKTVET